MRYGVFFKNSKTPYIFQDMDNFTQSSAVFSNEDEANDVARKLNALSEVERYKVRKI